MATAIETVRPTVLTGETVRRLDEYLRFRHLFRHIYGFDLEWERCRELLDDLPATFERLTEQLAAFDVFLETLEREVLRTAFTSCSHCAAKQPLRAKGLFH
jgi:hypothetical protein